MNDSYYVAAVLLICCPIKLQIWKGVQFCQTFNIKKRRSSAYHSRGNGLAERNIRNIREVIRTTLVARKLPQKSWVQLVNGVTFALNTTLSRAIKCTPFEVVHGRTALLPTDMKLGTIDSQFVGEVLPAKEFAKNLSDNVQEIYTQVNLNLEANREIMKQQYNKSIRVHNYIEGQQVWLKCKYYKTGESKKLAPRKSGPWTIVKILENGVNFEIKRNNNNKKTVVHHDRLIPLKESFSETDSSTDRSVENDNQNASIYETDSDNEDGEANLAHDAQLVERRYPIRERTQREIPGAIPWSAIDIHHIKNNEMVT